MFAELEDFILVHLPCGSFEDEVGEPSAEGYRLEVRCACGATFERWISPAIAAADLIQSRLLATDD